MKRRIAPSLIAGLSLVLSTSVFASTVTPEDQIKFRKAGYAFMSWNMGKIKAMTVDNPASFNREQVLASARAIAGIANSGMGALFSPASARDVGAQQTRVLPAFFEQPGEVRKVAIQFNQAANQLARVAESGDVNAIRSQFGTLGESCKACHDAFRAK